MNHEEAKEAIPGLLEKFDDFYASTVEPICEAADNFAVVSSDSYSEAAEICREIKSFVSYIDEQIKEHTEPIIKLHKDALRAGEAVTAPLKEALTTLLNKMAEFTLKSGAVPETEGMTERETYKFEVTDPAHVPPKYMIPDEKAIGAIVRKSKGQVEISGVRVWTEKTKVISKKELP